MKLSKVDASFNAKEEYGRFNQIKSFKTIMDMFTKLQKYVTDVFKTSLEIFLQALKLSPNAQGYVSGSITELLLKNKLEDDDYEVKRVREKWEGQKHPNHHGDFYFRKKQDTNWFVLESKGVKSNSEKWHKLYNYQGLMKFLYIHSDKISWIKDDEDIEIQIKEWIHNKLPKFEDVYLNPLYDFEEIQTYTMPKRETLKSSSIRKLQGFTRHDINSMIKERLVYLMSRIKVLETHFVSGTSKTNERTQATPRKDEFNIISIDIVLRYNVHKFVFANPKQLDSSGNNPEHLQQNYVMGFIFYDDNETAHLELSDEWSDDFEDVYNSLNTEDAVNEEDMQIDSRFSEENI